MTNRSKKPQVDTQTIPIFSLMAYFMFFVMISCQPQKRNNIGQEDSPKRLPIDNAQYARCAFLNREVNEFRIVQKRLKDKFNQCVQKAEFHESWAQFDLAFGRLDSIIEISLQALQEKDYGNSKIYLVLQDSKDSLKSELFWREKGNIGNGNRDTRYALFNRLFKHCDSVVYNIERNLGTHFDLISYWEINEPKDDPFIAMEPTDLKYSTWEYLQFNGATLADSQEWLLLRQWKSLVIQTNVLQALIASAKC